MKKNLFLLISLGLLLVVPACEVQEPEIICLPQRVKKTISQGTNATALTADFKYENDLLHHVIYSDFQTHYYTYNSDGQLDKISRKNVQTYQKLESWMIYEEGELVRSDEYKIYLDRFTQADADTLYVGYRDFTFEGANLTGEKLFQVNPENQKLELSGHKEYEFDMSGNLSTYIWIDDLNNDTIEAYSYTYDVYRHPYSSLNLAFEGESYVNNIEERTDLLSGVVTSYQIIYGPTNFPTQINVKQESYLTEVRAIDYECK